MQSFLTRKRLFFGLFLALSLIVGEVWLFAANRLGDALHRKAFGNDSIADFCGSSEIGGFPFRLRFTCTTISAPLQLGAVAILVKADEARGVANLFSPSHIVLTLSSPLTVLTPDGAPLAKLRHDGLTLDLAWSNKGLDKARLDSVALDWRPDGPEPRFAFNLQKLVAEAVPADAQGGGVRLTLNGDGLTSPLLQAILKKPELGAVALSALVAPTPAPAGDWRVAAEAWRQKSGAVAIEMLEWRAGDASLTVDGTLTLDDAHRPVGRLNLTARGAGPLLAQFGVPSGLSQARDLIGALLGKAPAARTPANDALSAPLNLANGQIYLGPLRLPGALAPLY